ncbi:hypothetical protein [Neptunomonas sp.]|uniref:hypothetical protein n=1 Tax=Neptunomonas sp. TaxID=1971898 RepID=UPI0025CC0388|nr:hypothetical protein [Neptunomonas sp.]
MTGSKVIKHIKVLVGIAFSLGILVCLWLLPDMLEKKQSSKLLTVAEPCNLQHSHCRATHEEKSISLKVTPPSIPSMAPLTFTVTLDNIQAKTVILELKGKKMFMGINKIPLSPLPDGITWEGTTELAVCVTGTMVWLASILTYADATAEPNKATFEFESP